MFAKSVTCVLNAIFNMAGDMDEMQRGLESECSYVSFTSSAILNKAFSTQVTDFARAVVCTHAIWEMRGALQSFILFRGTATF